MNAKIRILLADDHPVFRDGLRQAIQNDPAMTITGEASDGEAAWRFILESPPDVAVLDVSMPKLNGLALARRLYEQKSPVAIVFVTMHDEEDMFHKAMEAGAKAFVLKESAVTDILSAIRAAAEGKHYLSPGISHYLVSKGQRKTALESEQPGLASLTPAERRVLKLISIDRTSKEIAEELGVSPRTVEAHRANICAKLNLRGSHSLLRFAFDHRNAF